MEVKISSTECGDKLAYFYIEVQDGAPISFQCRATFRGPIMKVLNPIVDFGLVKVKTKKNYSVTIENTTPIEAEIIVKNFKNKRLNFYSVS